MPIITSFLWCCVFIIVRQNIQRQAGRSEAYRDPTVHWRIPLEVRPARQRYPVLHADGPPEWNQCTARLGRAACSIMRESSSKIFCLSNVPIQLGILNIVTNKARDLADPLVGLKQRSAKSGRRVFRQLF